MNLNIFLPDDEYQEVVRMRQLRTRQYEVNGKEQSGYRWLLGANKCTVSNAIVKFTKDKKPYILVELIRKAEKISGERKYFAPHEHYLFSYDDLRLFCEAFGHELKPIPDDYPVLDYWTAVARRIKTFRSEITITIGVTKRSKRDDYGGQVLSLYGRIQDVYDYEILNYTGVFRWKDIYKVLNY